MTDLVVQGHIDTPEFERRKARLTARRLELNEELADPAKSIDAWRRRIQDGIRLLTALSTAFAAASFERVVKFLQARGGVEFLEHIEVLEPNSSQHAYRGTILPPATLLQARNDRKMEWKLMWTAGIAGLLLLLLTLLMAIMTHWLEWTFGKWLLGVVDRLGTAALATAGVSLANVLIYYFEIKRTAGIRWTLE